ncbi:Arm DNA-binding domain-containing protein [Lentibacillus jeotgali]|uniref:Arm DNA-binding domain-containing protein n=1 Tax=Lentibacillus jeotgali TaxID=558169 RepID=UPI0003090BBB|nr:Arm DNA-binding domain-containing protein [Lentibacillus jeotgali]
MAITISNKEKPIRKSGFRTKKEAQVAAAEVEDKLNKGKAVVMKELPIDEYFEQWISLYKTKISDATMKQYQYSLKAVKNHFGRDPIQNITRQDYQRFINDFGANKAKETVQ